MRYRGTVFRGKAHRNSARSRESGRGNRVSSHATTTYRAMLSNRIGRKALSRKVPSRVRRYGIRDGRLGMRDRIQRFGGGLNLNIHSIRCSSTACSTRPARETRSSSRPLPPRRMTSRRRARGGSPRGCSGCSSGAGSIGPCRPGPADPVAKNYRFWLASAAPLRRPAGSALRHAPAAAARQKPRPLQENATSRSNAQSVHRRRAKPCARTPRSGVSESCSTKPGSEAPSA